MKRLALILFAIFSINTYANESLFNKANQLYSQEKYHNAILLYDSIISNGLESSEIYYNIGNCYYKKSDWANAIWYYEKSLKLNYKKSTKENLELVKLKIIDQIETIPQLFYEKWWDNLLSIFKTITWQILSIITICFVVFTKTINLATSLKKDNLSRFLAIIAISLFFISTSSYNKNYSKKEAIIFSSSVAVNSAPTNKSTNLFSLHSGTKVEITDSIGEWIKIQIPNGNNGWIKESECKFL
tara:strand:+ start:2005 stop:2733 length:729 start_codon:yes stop_codon:yes gene_type:complete